MARNNNFADHPPEDSWIAWPVSWSAAWVGALTALAVLIVIGLIGVAVGAHVVGPSNHTLSWRQFGWLALAFSVGGAFFSFVAAGWVAGTIAGTRRAEPAMLHGAIAWLVAVPLLVVLAGLGGASLLGSWYGGLAATPVWAQASAPKAAAAPADESERQAAEDAARAARNSALGGLTALLLGLIGSVIGGWMASGEPMGFGHYFRATETTTRLKGGPAALSRS